MTEGMLLRHAALVISARFTVEGSRIVTATDQSATIWDTATGAGLYTTTNVANYLADALLPDNWSLFLADIGFGDSCLLDVLTGQETTTFAMIQP
jgi:hypothetical protein